MFEDYYTVITNKNYEVTYLLVFLLSSLEHVYMVP